MRRLASFILPLVLLVALAGCETLEKVGESLNTMEPQTQQQVQDAIYKANKSLTAAQDTAAAAIKAGWVQRGSATAKAIVKAATIAKEALVEATDAITAGQTSAAKLAWNTARGAIKGLQENTPTQPTGPPATTTGE